jgi:antitoxin (DNA-binding transcriptional repressor) of toxin-antitoxin stability system
MRISVADAGVLLPDLVKQARAGEEIILTCDGRAVVRLVPTGPVADAQARRKLLEAVRLEGAARATAGPTAERSQDFLYNTDDYSQRPAGR